MRFLKIRSCSILFRRSLKCQPDKSRLDTSVHSAGQSAQQGSDVFNSDLILNTLLQPAVPNGLLNVSWSGQGPCGNLSNLLQTLGLPESTRSASIPSSLGLVNGNSVPAVATNTAALNSFAEIPTAGPLSVPVMSTPVPPPGANSKKRTGSRDPQSRESKRSKNAEFDEQLHSEVILVVRLSGNYVYSSSKDGIVKRTPLQDGAGSVVLYKHW